MCIYIILLIPILIGETENIRAVAEMKMEGKRPRGRPKLRWKYTVRRDLKAWKIKEEWATDRERWKGLCKTRYPEQGDGGKRWERWDCWYQYMLSEDGISVPVAPNRAMHTTMPNWFNYTYHLVEPILAIYTTKIDGVVCPPNISETVAGRLTKLAHRQRIASTTIKLI